VILFASNPRGDVKLLAKDLLERFGGFAELPRRSPAPGSVSPGLPRSNRCVRRRFG
jgi:hypothetical protein